MLDVSTYGRRFGELCLPRLLQGKGQLIGSKFIGRITILGDCRMHS